MGVVRHHQGSTKTRSKWGKRAIDEAIQFAQAFWGMPRKDIVLALHPLLIKYKPWASTKAIEYVYDAYVRKKVPAKEDLVGGTEEARSAGARTLSAKPDRPKKPQISTAITSPTSSSPTPFTHEDMLGDSPRPPPPPPPPPQEVASVPQSTPAAHGDPPPPEPAAIDDVDQDFLAPHLFPDLPSPISELEDPFFSDDIQDMLRWPDEELPSLTSVPSGQSAEVNGTTERVRSLTPSLRGVESEEVSVPSRSTLDPSHGIPSRPPAENGCRREQKRDGQREGSTGRARQHPAPRSGWRGSSTEQFLRHRPRATGDRDDARMWGQSSRAPLSSSRRGWAVSRPNLRWWASHHAARQKRHIDETFQSLIDGLFDNMRSLHVDRVPRGHRGYQRLPDRLL